MKQVLLLIAVVVLVGCSALPEDYWQIGSRHLSKKPAKKAEWSLSNAKYWAMNGNELAQRDLGWATGRGRLSETAKARTDSTLPRTSEILGGIRVFACL